MVNINKQKIDKPSLSSLVTNENTGLGFYNQEPQIIYNNLNSDKFSEFMKRNRS